MMKNLDYSSLFSSLKLGKLLRKVKSCLRRFFSQCPQLDEADSKEYSFEEMSLESWAAAESKNCELDPTKS